MISLPDQARHLCRPQPAWLVLAAAATLSGIGILAIETAVPVYGAIQLRWLIISLLVAAICAMPHPRLIAMVVAPLSTITLCFLVMIILPFMPRSIVPVRNGATCWVNLHFMMFQPSELAKIVFVLSLALYLRYRNSFRTLRGLLVPFVLMFVPVLLILKEPDLGTALIFAPAMFVMLVAAGARLAHLTVLIGLVLLAVVVNIAVIYTLPDSLQILKPHQRQRIVAMISRTQGDRRYVDSIGYQQEKAITLVGSGGVAGMGAERSHTMVRFNRLPESHNDMIFAVIVNRWGLWGGGAVMGLYLVLILSLLQVAAGTKDPFARLTTVGFAGLIFSQAVINIGMAVGLLPVTGITLPFISYGGSSLAASYAMVGLVINFASRRPVYGTRPAFEFDGGDAVATPSGRVVV